MSLSFATGLGPGFVRGIPINPNILAAPSENWASASWATDGATKSVSGIELTLTNAATLNVHGVYPTTTTVAAGARCFLSVEAKAGTYSWIGVSLHNGATTAGNEWTRTFNLATGALGSTYNTAPASSGVLDVDGTWRRYWIEIVIGTTTANPTFWSLDSDRDPRVSWTSLANSILLRRPKLEVGSLTPYIAT